MRVTFENENDFNKKARALRKYFMKSYKDLIFNVSKNLKDVNSENGFYEIKLYTDSTFKKVYGDIKIIYQVLDDMAIIKDLEPADFLLDAHAVELNCYKGLPYRNARELFKIKLLLN